MKTLEDLKMPRRQIFVVGLVAVMALCAVFSGVPRASAEIIVTTSDDLGPYGTNERALGATYQNTTGKLMMVYVGVDFFEEGLSAQLYIGPTSPNILLSIFMPPISTTVTVQGLVPNGWYYKVRIDGPTGLEQWIEQTLEDNYAGGPPGENGAIGPAGPVGESGVETAASYAILFGVLGVAVAASYRKYRR